MPTKQNIKWLRILSAPPRRRARPFYPTPCITNRQWHLGHKSFFLIPCPNPDDQREKIKIEEERKKRTDVIILRPGGVSTKVALWGHASASISTKNRHDANYAIKQAMRASC